MEDTAIEVFQEGARSRNILEVGGCGGNDRSNNRWEGEDRRDRTLLQLGKDAPMPGLMLVPLPEPTQQDYKQSKYR